MAKTFTNITVANATAGNAILASDHSSAFTTLNSHTVPPMAKVKRDGTSQSITPGVSAYVAWNNSSAEIDTDGMWSSGSNTRLTVQTAGVYQVTWGIAVAWSGVSYHSDLVLTHTTSGGTETIIAEDYWYLNGDNWVYQHNNTITAYINAAVGDYFRCKWANQVNGTSPIVGGAANSYMFAKWIGKTA